MLGCSGEAFIISGTGTLAMEAAVANSVKAGDSILILSNGFFGDRFISLCRRKGLDVDIIQAEWGRPSHRRSWLKNWRRSIMRP
jgi:aspartate aminotransferase-like enzyme